MRELLIQLIDALTVAQGEGSSPMASLERSIAAAGRAHIAARRALAVAIAEESREAKRRAGLVVGVDDLERRAVAALRAGREDLAVEASEAIAAIATEIAASERAAQRFAAEVALARREVDAQRRRLAELDRGRRLAKIGSALAGTMHTSRSGHDSFGEAEAALARVLADNDDARAVRHEMAPAEHLIERMSEAGFGEASHIKASDVLARLKSAALAIAVPTLIESTSNSK
ncbi:MAG: PspA/IM30 family protein [Bradyrhizobium sp.]|nr:PspA/IM30 family protein [Bradyrhizobium sp.]